MRHHLKIHTLISLLVLILFCSPKAFGCASCGSGGDDPLILYPNENVKFYFALSRAGNFKTVDVDGKNGTDGGPQFKDSVTLAVGKAISNSSFVTLTIPYLQNWKNDSFKRAWGDPIFAGRWSVVQQSFDDPLVPQVQLMGAYKFAHARSIQETQYSSALDVFGTGVSETKVGLDMFWGMLDWKVGLAHAFYLPGSRQFENTFIEPGIAQRTTAMAGYGFGAHAKVLGGLNRDYRAQKRVNGVVISRSQEQYFSLFCTADWMIDPSNTVRATYSKKAAVFRNVNTSKSDSFTLAAMTAL